MALIEKNAEYLERQIFYLGVDIDQEKFRKMLSASEGKSFEFEGKPKNFNYGKDLVTETLKFDLSDKGNYFISNMEVSLKRDENKHETKQNFAVSKYLRFPLKESYNLMIGRSVYKEKYNLDKNVSDQDNSKVKGNWYYLDFKSTDKQGNATLLSESSDKMEKLLNKENIKNYHIPKVRIKIHNKLRKGDLAYVIVENNGKREERYLEYSAKYGAINRYTLDGKRIYASLDESKKNNVSNGLAAKDGNKQNADQKMEKELKKRTSRGKAKVV